MQTEQTFFAPGERFARLSEYMAKLPSDARVEFLTALDELTRPMTIREVEYAVIAHGASRTQAKKLANAINRRGILLVAFDPERID